VIGAKVLDKLRGIDEVAYLRYASVYQQFQDVDQFVDAIHTLGRRVKPNALQKELFPPDAPQNPAPGSHNISTSKKHGRV
jgi:transcriptional repressor NrdR